MKHNLTLERMQQEFLHPTKARRDWVWVLNEYDLGRARAVAVSSLGSKVDCRADHQIRNT
jgi:hypothetical protein